MRPGSAHHAIQHLLEVVNADADKDAKVREEAATLFERMDEEKEEGLTWRVWRELQTRSARG